jgi:hypothetical protein
MLPKSIFIWELSGDEDVLGMKLKTERVNGRNEEVAGANCEVSEMINGNGMVME